MSNNKHTYIDTAQNCSRWRYYLFTPFFSIKFCLDLNQSAFCKSVVEFRYNIFVDTETTHIHKQVFGKLSIRLK